MKPTSNFTNNLFRRSITTDNPDIKPNKGIEERLNYHFLLKQPRQRVHTNSFTGMFFWLFSLKSLGFKASLVSACLLYFLFIGNINEQRQNEQFTDTCQVSKTAVDTFYMSKDSCK